MARCLALAALLAAASCVLLAVCPSEVGGADAAGLGEEVGEDAWIYSDEDEGD